MESPGEIIDAAYELLSFQPGQEPDWAGFNACFHPRALLGLRVFPDDAAISVLSLSEYAQAQMRDGLREEGYSEVPGNRDVEVVGSIATVRQHFTMSFAGRVPVAAIDVFSLARLDGRWQIVSVVSDMTSAG